MVIMHNFFIALLRLTKKIFYSVGLMTLNQFLQSTMVKRKTSLFVLMGM